MQICSGCDNECEIGEQYCSECLSEIALEDWIDAQSDEDEGAIYALCFEHDWVIDSATGHEFCVKCGLVWKQ